MTLLRRILVPDAFAYLGIYGTYKYLIALYEQFLNVVAGLFKFRSEQVKVFIRPVNFSTVCYNKGYMLKSELMKISDRLRIIGNRLRSDGCKRSCFGNVFKQKFCFFLDHG